MRFYNNGTEYPDGSTVELGTELDLIIEVTYNNDGK